MYIAKGAINMNRKMMCIQCGNFDEYEMKMVIRKYRGEDYSFGLEVNVPFCKKCGAPIVDEEIEEAISRQANKKIREIRGIISTQEIKDILNKYNVSQKFLSKLLGWGEITLTRYITGGYTPNKENSQKLKKLSNPYIFLKLLNEKEAEDSKIKEELSYKKSYRRVYEAIKEVEYQKGKIYCVVNWFLSQSTDDNPLTHLALQKLLYFVQGWSIALRNEWFFDDCCEAWIHGAVYRDVYEEFKFFKYNPLPKLNRESDLNSEEITFLEEIKKNYFDVYTARMLENICHKETPYILIREGYEERQSCSEVINKEVIETYYRKVAKEYDITKENMKGIKLYLYRLLSE